MKLENIPQELKGCAQWILWVGRKIPVQPDKSPASSTDHETWSTFETVVAAYKSGGFAGIGFVFTRDDDFCGIDLDSCRDPQTGEWAEWARDVIRRLDTYTELSPSGTGAKAFCVGSHGLETGRNIKLPDEKRYGDKEAGIEIYDQGRYFAVTGERLTGLPTTIEPRQLAIDTVVAKYNKPAETGPSQPRQSTPLTERASRYVAKIPPAVAGEGGHNQAFHVACVLVKGFGLDQGQARSIFDEYNQTCQPPWSDKEIRHKLTSAAKASGESGYLVGVAEHELRNVPMPVYSEKPVEVGANVRATTLQAATAKYIERLATVGENLIPLGLADVDQAIGGGVEEGEVVVIGARPSHGKSMAAMQICHTLTASGVPCCFMSEEMSAMALGRRTISYASNIPRRDWEYRTVDLKSQLSTHFEHRADLHIVETCGTADRVATEIERLATDEGVKVAVVDYVQLLTAKGGGRYEQVTNASTTLTQMARRTGVTLILLAQLSRAIESRETFQPRASDLKESGQLEQDADVILFMVWPHKLDAERPEHEYHIYVAKNRNREIKSHHITCEFRPAEQKIKSSIAEPDPPVDFKWLASGEVDTSKPEGF